MGFFDKLLDIASSNKSSSDMSDRELQRKLDRGVEKNTGEDIATRVSYIREGERRGIYPNQDKK